MNRFFQRWDAWWMRPCPPHALAIFRIVFGLYLLIEAATYLPFTRLMFSTDGLVFPMQFGIPVLPPWLAWIISWGFVAVTIAFTLGYRMRTALALLILYYLYYWQLSFYAFPSSYHRIFFTAFLVLLLGGADKTFSVRMKREKGDWAAWEPISILPQRLLTAQLTATYTVVGIQKWWLPHWRGGEILYYSFIGRWGTPFARWFVSFGWPMWVYDLMTLTTKVLETLMPIGFWIPRVRWFFFAWGLVFHFLVAVMLGIWWFLVLVPAYILFFEPEVVHEFLKRRFPRIVR